MDEFLFKLRWLKIKLRNGSLFSCEIQISMRLLLNLFLSDKKERTLEELIIADFITNYSKEFGIAKTNLHGENEFSFSEFPTRRLLGKNAIKILVLKNLVNVGATNQGFQYSISNRGMEICKSLTSDYVQEYKVYAKKANFFMKTLSEKELLDIITSKAYSSLRKG